MHISRSGFDRTHVKPDDFFAAAIVALCKKVGISEKDLDISKEDLLSNYSGDTHEEAVKHTLRDLDDN